MSTAKAQPNGVTEPKVPITPSESSEVKGLMDTIAQLTDESDKLKATIREMVETAANAPKAFDSYFTVEYQSQLAAKYRVKYSQIEQDEHKKQWPVFAGNEHTMFILAEMTAKAQDAVFAANSKLFLNDLISAANKYSATKPGAVLTEMQVAYNKICDMELATLRDKIPNDSQRTDLLKMYSKGLKLAAKTPKDTETNLAKFTHAALALGCKTPSTLW